MGDRVACRVFVGRPEEMRTLGRIRRRWEDNTKTDFSRSLMGRMNSTDLSQDRDRCRLL
jgi:hypothetical protein